MDNTMQKPSKGQVFFFAFLYAGYASFLGVFALILWASLGVGLKNKSVTAAVVCCLLLAVALLISLFLKSKVMSYVCVALNVICFTSPLFLWPSEKEFWGFAFMGVAISCVLWLAAHYALPRPSLTKS